MKTFVYTVEDVFQITGRGCVVMAGLPDGELAVRPGAGVVLKRPDGSEITTTVRGTDPGVRGENGVSLAILLAEITKDDVPIGTEVWLV